jgi:hypothetical protein
MDVSGLPGMIQVGARLELEFPAMVATFVGAHGWDKKDAYTLELVGDFIQYTVQVDGGWVFVKAALADSVDAPELLLKEADTANGWDVARRLVARLERNCVRSLSRPIESGYGDGPENWIIW